MPMPSPPHSKTASSTCRGFLPRTRWYALYLLSLFLDALVWFTVTRSSSKTFLRRCFGTVSCHLVVIFLAVPHLHVLSCHFSTGPPVMSLHVCSHRFQLSLQKSLNTSCDLMYVPCSHELSKCVFVSAMSRIRTVLFHLPGHLVVLCFLLGACLH